MKKKMMAHTIAELFNLSLVRGMEAVIKAQLIKGAIDALMKQELTHQ